MFYKYYKIVLDGIDKTGKDTIREYVRAISKGRYTCSARGVMSLIAYSFLYKREANYDLKDEASTLHVVLSVEEGDWKLRCKLTKEPQINFKDNEQAFKLAKDELISNKVKVIEYNTSYLTPWTIANDIVKYMDYLNGTTLKVGVQ